MNKRCAFEGYWDDPCRYCFFSIGCAIVRRETTRSTCRFRESDLSCSFAERDRSVACKRHVKQAEMTAVRSSTQPSARSPTRSRELSYDYGHYSGQTRLSVSTRPTDQPSPLLLAVILDSQELRVQLRVQLRLGTSIRTRLTVLMLESAFVIRDKGSIVGFHAIFVDPRGSDLISRPTFDGNLRRDVGRSLVFVLQQMSRVSR